MISRSFKSDFRLGFQSSDLLELKTSFYEPRNINNLLVDVGKLAPWVIDLSTFNHFEELVIILGSNIGYLKEFFVLVHPEDRNRTQSALLQAITHEANLNVEFRLQIEEDNFHWMRWTGEMKRTYGSKTHTISGVLFDIEEVHIEHASLQHTEDLYKLIVESSTGFAILTLDINGNVTSWNTGAEHILGWKSDEILNRSSRLIFTAEDCEHQQFEKELEGALKNGRAEDERWHVRKDGSRFWANGLMMPLKNQNDVIVGFLKILRDESAKFRERERADLLTKELNHRVKNTLASVESIAQLTLRSKPNPEEFADAFMARLMALSKAQNLLTRQSWQDIPLADVIQQTIAPYMNQPNVIVDCSGNAVTLKPKQALSLSMTFHELATNASKYGIFSKQGGHLTISWRLSPMNDLSIDWIESGGPKVDQTQRFGFGTRLIKQNIAYELRGNVSQIFDVDGMKCSIKVNLNVN